MDTWDPIQKVGQGASNSLSQMGPSGAQEASPITKAHGDAIGALVHCEQALAELTNRLTPVLRPVPPQAGGTDGPRPQMATEIADRFAEVGTRLSAMARHVGSLIDRCDL